MALRRSINWHYVDWFACKVECEYSSIVKRWAVITYLLHHYHQHRYVAENIRPPNSYRLMKYIAAFLPCEPKAVAMTAFLVGGYYV